MYQYNARVTRVVDGDTVHLDIDTGFGIHFATVVRMTGIDCPELSTSQGKVARQYVVDWLARNAPFFLGVGHDVVVVTSKDKADKYGRYLASIYANGKSLTEDLIDSGNAVPYDGGKR